MPAGVEGATVERRTTVGAACAFISRRLRREAQVAPVVVFLEAKTGIHASLRRQRGAGTA